MTTIAAKQTPNIFICSKFDDNEYTNQFLLTATRAKRIESQPMTLIKQFA